MGVEQSSTATDTKDAGEFGAWRSAMAASLRGNAGTDVPCGDCVGCCSSSWPVALRAEDDNLREAIPAEFLLNVPNAPPGVRYLGYRADGTCPLLTHHRCTVYARRPQTCRDFDCRLFAAAGIDSAGPGKPLIDQRIKAWRFRYAHADDERTHHAMRATAAFLVAAIEHMPSLRLPRSAVAIAGIAFKAHAVFLNNAHHDLSVEALAHQVLAAAGAFDRSSSSSN